MQFEWDENKNRTNIAKHGIGFETAVRIFDGPTLDWIDEREDYDELRTISVGMIDAILIAVVIHTDREGVTRIISARPAKRSERRIYESEIQKRTDA